MKKIVLVPVFLLGFCSVAFADPDPFGLELNKTTFNQVAKKYPKYETLDGLSLLKGKRIRIKVNEFELEGILHYLGFKMYDYIGVSDTFNVMWSSLRKKYKQTKQNVSFNRYQAKLVEFENGNSLVLLRTDPLSSNEAFVDNLSLVYETKKYNKVVKESKKQKAKKSKTP